jgi:hypothetical protein
MDFNITPEEEEELIEKIAEYVHKHRLNDLAGIVLETATPLSFIGTQMGRFFLSPFLPGLGANLEASSEKILHVFERRANVERLIRRIDQLDQEEKKREKERKEEEKRLRQERGEEEPDDGGLKTWWRRFFGGRPQEKAIE